MVNWIETWILGVTSRLFLFRICLTVCLHLAAISAHDVPDASRKKQLKKAVVAWLAAIRPCPRAPEAVQHPGFTWLFIQLRARKLVFATISF